jgi:Uma2 family endonuclease
MASVQEPFTVADLLEQLGGIDPRRIRMKPPPGKATEKDLLKIHNQEDRLYELVDGVLVEKAMGYAEGAIAAVLIRVLGNWVFERDLGIIAGADSTMRLMQGLVRLPDLSFISWKRLGKHEYPSEPIPELAPELAVEVLSIGNTPGEMRRKLQEYFLAGVDLVWLINPDTRTVDVVTARDQVRRRLDEDQVLDGGTVLPGFTLPVKDIFVHVPQPSAPPKGTHSSRSRKKPRQP